MTTQPELFRPKAEPERVEWLVGYLSGWGWTTAAAILGALDMEPTESNKRKVRAWADASKGRVVGHQLGYRLVSELTEGEYTHWRNESLKACDSIKNRVLESDRVFYGRKAA